MHSPEYYFNKGIEYYEQKEYLLAIEAFSKAEEASENGAFPAASYNKGVCLAMLKRYEEAIESYIKAIKDNGGAFPAASKGLGNVLYEQKKYEEAIASYNKAIDDNGGAFPGTSYNKGITLREQKRYDEAIIAYNKAIDDNGGAFPSASYNKSVCLAILKRYEEAIASYNKAIVDNGGAFPDASNNKGSVLRELKKYEEAIDSYNKAIDDNGGAYPSASCNKGICYHYDKNDIANAIIAYKKAINDSDEIFPNAHLHLSKALLTVNKEEAHKHAFIALKCENRGYKYVENIAENFSNNSTQHFYTNRLQYLDVEYEEMIMAAFEGADIDVEDKQTIRFFERLNNKNADSLSGFQLLLKTELVSFPNTISQHERLKLTYLTHYIHNEPWQCFHIIDQHIDGQFTMDGMDYYFYLLSTYQIAEPISEITYLLDDIEVPTTDPFYNDYCVLVEAVRTGINDGHTLDPYLLKLNIPQLSKQVLDESKQGYHKWIKKALAVVVNPETIYEIPISNAEIQGLSTQLIKTILAQLKTEPVTENHYLTNLKYSLNIKSTEYDYSTIIKNIREAIKSKVPYYIILGMLFEKYTEEQDENIKHNITILQAATWTSHYVEYIKHSSSAINTVEIPATTLIDNVAHTAAEILFASIGSLIDLGLGVVIGFLAKRGFVAFQKIEQDKINEEFEVLLGHIR